MFEPMPHPSTPDLHALARQALLEAGFEPDFPPASAAELAALGHAPPVPARAVRDERALLWSSIDNSDSRDLDQVEYAERLPGGDIRILVGIADVDEFVPKGGSIDEHARANTVSVYAPGTVFPMLPAQLSTDLTSLLPGGDKLAVVIALVVGADGAVVTSDVYRALVRNHAQLVYEEVGAWLEGHAPLPAEIAQVAGLEAQLRLQDEATVRLSALRRRNGALNLEIEETAPVVVDGKVVALTAKEHNRARDIIESFMVAANTAMAELLEARGVPSLRRVVHKPEQWARMVEIAAELHEHLPAEPNSPALAYFLARRRAADPAHYRELSLAVLKLLGAGEYMVEAPGLDQEGHFGLGVGDYTHSTAPNRRYPDLVTQRCLKSVIAHAPPPYTTAELYELAAHCNLMESAARKVERRMRKVAAAALLYDRLGEIFTGIVTGVKEHGTFVKLLKPPVSGKIVKGAHGLHVGDKTRVRLVATDAARGFIDFARVH
ncbi:MAG TPA: RNB domain-containing ribonuclease [Pyrinomonadaceae bacterium]|jgi:exoribonuclease-2